MLDKQVQILSIDTGNFYSNHEALLHWKNHKLRVERNNLVEQISIVTEELSKYGIDDDDLVLIYKDEYDYSGWECHEDYDKILDLCSQYCSLKNFILQKNKQIKLSKEKLLTLLSNKTNCNLSTNGKHHIRELRNINASSNEKRNIFSKLSEPLEDNNLISVFDSFFTRTIGAMPNTYSDDFMVVQVYYFDIIKDLIYHGFIYKGEKYRYFTSSAGQIRTKKTVFVKESTWMKYENTITCGLTMDKINLKGGCNSNKYLAYTALANSATDEWKEFDINKTIVVDDFETNVNGLVDFINDKDYTITKKKMDVPVPHMDGAGIMLPCMGRNRMVRLPWIKGLLGAFDYVKFIETYNCSSIVTDIYGEKHDVIKEDIQIIFTKSQFKMWKYYESWDEYKQCFIKYGCTAGYINMEVECIKDASINYQMLQSLTDITEKEMINIAQPSIKKLKNICSSINSLKSIFGITPYNTNQTYFQKSIDLYPNLLNDISVKKKVRDIKDSIIKQFKSGKLRVSGKYTFVLPDLFAFCEWLFMGKENPDGLLNDGEVFCLLFRKNNLVDCLRSPHLYKEHAIRLNVASNDFKDKQEKLSEWFSTNAIYVSTHDLISKILQFDCDGDTLLVVSDSSIINTAIKNTKDIVPLYYDMKKASPVILNNESIYNGLNTAFTHGNIGIYSNNISKIYNSETFINGTDKEKQNALNIIKLLCMENNMTIDSAKTLYMPERPDWFSEQLKVYTNNKLPAFFRYAKDKTNNQVESKNGSFVNRLDDIIPNVRLNFRRIDLEKPDYTLLMNNPDIECKVNFTKTGKIISEETDPLILKYIELNKKYYFKMDSCNNIVRGELLNNSQLKEDLVFRRIKTEMLNELSKFGYTNVEITDILVKFLYHIKNSKHKDGLWLCYGNIIYNNLLKHINKKSKTMECIDCGKWFEIKNKDNKTCRCSDCYSVYRKNRKLETQRRRRKMKSEQII